MVVVGGVWGGAVIAGRTGRYTTINGRARLTKVMRGGNMKRSTGGVA